jgi:NAD(P)-dependent dehydrogenase (short-subunit alcohol dehydrogenase family)
MDIHGVSALVTGAASGLGAATAAALAERGASVYGLDLADSIKKASSGLPVVLLEADVTDPDEVAGAIAEVERGGQPLRVVINCAGIGPSARVLSRKGPHDLSLFAKILHINVVGTFNVLRLAAEVMSRNEPVDATGQRGVVVNTSSVAAFEGQIGQVAYAASKGGVHSMTLPAARDLAQFGIRVNTIAPGIVDTPMLATVTDEFRAALGESVPFPKRLATAEEFASLALSIVDQDYLNGETIRLDGALRMAPR